MLLPARPTIRCLQSDLVDGIEDSVQQQAARVSPDRCRPLHAIEHLALRRAQEMFPVGQDVEAKRESISSAKGHPWWKLKTSEWRGAVHQDLDSGQVWLCAVARRREGDTEDFYRQFGSLVASRGHEEFLPTEEDRRLLKKDLAAHKLAVWKERIQALALEALDGAVAGGSETTLLPHPVTAEGLARLTVDIFRLGAEEESGVVEVTVTIETSARADVRLVESAEIVVLAAVDPNEQAWRTGFASEGMERIHSQVLNGSDFAAFVDVAHLTRAPGETRAGRHSHWTADRELTQKTVEGRAIEGLCGVWFVPRQDHAKYDMCPQCDERYQSLEPANP